MAFVKQGEAAVVAPKEIALRTNDDGTVTVYVEGVDAGDICTIGEGGITVHDGLSKECGILRKNGSLRALVSGTGITSVAAE